MPLKKLLKGLQRKYLRTNKLSELTLESRLLIDNMSVGYDCMGVLYGTSARLTEGETVALLRTNGNGKSMLIKCFMGIVKPDSGWGNMNW